MSPPTPITKTPKDTPQIPVSPPDVPKASAPPADTTPKETPRPPVERSSDDPGRRFQTFAGSSEPHHHHHTHGARETSGKGSGKAAVPKSTKYDGNDYTLTPPASGLTTKQIDEQLAKKFPKGYTVDGVKPGSEEERRVKHALLQLSDPSRKNSETDVLVDLGNGKKGRVTVGIDKDGIASAKLHAQGEPKVNADFSKLTLDEAKEKLKKDFGLKAVTDGGASWTKEELAKVHDAFSRMSPDERKALKGVELKREASLATKEDPNRVGSFDWQVKPDGTRSETLSLDNRVFEADKRGFVGKGDKNDMPASARTILHEAGHAVESKKLRDSWSGYNSAAAAYNSKLAEYRKEKDPAAKKALKKELDTLSADAKAKKTEFDAAKSGASSKRLKDFTAYVKKNKIEPPTDYARENWPKKAGELYAEAYSLYKTDPAYLEKHHPKLYEYFRDGKHL
jgi:hypothetical protein